MNKTLEMVFITAGERRATIRVPDPKEDLTGVQVKAVMDDIVAKNIFSVTSGELVQVHSARIVQREVIPVELA